MVELPLHPADGRRRGGEEGGRRREEKRREDEGGEEGGRRRGEGVRRGRKLKHTWGRQKRTQKAKNSLQSKEKNNCDEEADDGNTEPNFGDNLQR